MAARGTARAARPSERTKGTGTSNSAHTPSATVTPDHSTVRPAWFIVATSASSGARVRDSTRRRCTMSSE